MLTRRFGRTELQMPVFSCGGMRYHYKWQDVPLDEVPPEKQAHLEATIGRSLELGINHIETARDYGSSERQLGLVLPTFPRDQIIVQTKIAPTADPEQFVQHFQESLERLQLQRVDLLAFHGVNTYKHLWQTLRPQGCLEAARKLQKKGLADHIGFSTHGTTEFILDAIAHEDNGGFDYINLHWYYIFQDNWPAIAAAAERDMGVFIISPSSKGGMLYKPSPKLVELCQPVHPLVFNCLFCLAQREVHTLSLGASCPADFDLQVSTLEHLDRSSVILPTIIARLREALVDTVGSDLADRYAEGLPDWENTQGFMN
ncbi:MAG TPA: aldo/keto reductase, partial [Planctomycetaceae bacterium]|nr:aldo/keto reductase [Planctomycetaceae bacterium]